MHLALIISSLAAGGAERVLSALANAWVSRGHIISIITLEALAASPPMYPLDPQIRLIRLDELSSENLFLFRRARNIGRRILKLRNTLKALGPDVIISFGDITNMTTLFASRGLGVPVIASERTHPLYHPLPELYKKLRRLTYLWADKVICQTASASHYFSTLPEAKKRVIPNGVKKPMLQKREADILKPVRQIVSVGRLCPHKSFDALILAFSKIISQNPQLKLIIYGEGPERQNLETRIRDLALTKHVFLPGVIKDIERALCQSDIFVFPSRYEGFPNALCEAMAIGLPTLASRCSGAIDIVRDGVDGRLFPVEDAAQLTKLLTELIHDPVQRLKLSQEALSLPDRFSEASVLQLWDGVLAEMGRI